MLYTPRKRLNRFALYLAVIFVAYLAGVGVLYLFDDPSRRPDGLLIIGLALTRAVAAFVPGPNEASDGFVNSAESDRG